MLNTMDGFNRDLMCVCEWLAAVAQAVFDRMEGMRGFARFAVWLAFVASVWWIVPWTDWDSFKFEATREWRLFINDLKVRR